MLVSLSIRNIVLIDRLDLSFGPGLTILTGETGAGKSIILDSLSLALGARGDAGLVKSGAMSGSVAASFDLPAAHPLFSIVDEHRLLDGDSLILRRVQFADGKTKAFVNDNPVSTSLLRQLAQGLVEIHGQHADRALLDASSHRQLVDRFGGLAFDVDAVGVQWREWRRYCKEAEALKAELDRSEKQADYLRASCQEFDELSPEEGEEEALATKRQSLQASAKLRGDLEAAADALSDREFPLGKLSTILRRLERQSDLPPAIKPLIAGIERVVIEAEEARALVEAQLRDQGSGDIEAIEERLFRLRAVARKHRVPVTELKALQGRMEAQLGTIELGSERLEAIGKAAHAASKAYAAAADILSQKRAAVAAKLDKAVQRELKPLKLEKASFITHIEAEHDAEGGVRGGPYGREAIMFHVSTNPGAKAGLLTKVASGGELARFLLALKTVLAEKNTAPVLVFDEIDTGVGGATAAAIGERLARIGQQAQVIAVTHSPQVAAHADSHYRLYKTSHGNGGAISVETYAEALDGSGRREEIARMLAGKMVTDEARAAAERLIGGKHDAG